MIELSRTQIDALSDLRYRASWTKVAMHYNTRRSLIKLGLARWDERKLVLTEAGRLVIDTVGELIEGTAPLGTDELGNQIRELSIVSAQYGDRTFSL